jgi:hypothetical protein
VGGRRNGSRQLRQDPDPALERHRVDPRAEPEPQDDSYLRGVAAITPSSAWAVGYAATGTSFQALIVRWNGSRWTRVPSPSPAGSSLSAVTATSARNAWAVGSTGTGKTLILHWNCTAWTQVPSPSPAPSPELLGVTATSANNAWAVGQTGTAGRIKTLILHWNGATWK